VTLVSEVNSRRAGVAARFEEHGIEALLVSALPNIRYLSGFTGSNAALLILRGSATLFTDPRYTLQASAESDCPVVIAKGSLQAAAMKLIRRKRLRRVGVEKNRILLSSWLDLNEAAPPTLKLVPVPAFIEQARMVKSPDEIDRIRQSVDTNSKAYAKVLTRLKPTATEKDIAAEIEFQQRRFGAEGPAFESIVAAGPRSALPHARPSSERIGTNRLLLMDTGALQSGYCSDMTRVVHLGSPGSKAKKLYRAVLEAQLAGISVVRPGITAGAIDRAARGVLEKYGFGDAFLHSTGHGLGLEIHEMPRIGLKDKTRLEAGMVITIEPGAYLDGFGGVRVEDTVLVTSNGCEILTPTSKEFVVV
jgi:Xaa-Pro aminopeptidase